jgi:hypothetical protein
MLELHRRLVWIFGVETATFERKTYASLSHEANKAMNLNAYIGLMGGRFREERIPEGVVLRPVAGAQSADLVVPNAEYLLTLDADSLLLRDYCLRLVYLLEQPDNAASAAIDSSRKVLYLIMGMVSSMGFRVANCNCPMANDAFVLQYVKSFRTFYLSQENELKSTITRVGKLWHTD